MTSFLHSSKSKTNFARELSQNFTKSLVLIFCLFAFKNLSGQVDCNFSLDATGNPLVVNGLESPGSFTLEAWVFTSDVDGTILDFADQAPSLEIVDDTLRLFGSVEIISDTTAFPDDTWTHVAVTYDDDDEIVRLFINGELVATVFEEVETDGENLTVGDNDGLTAPLDGDLDEVRIWSIARSQANIISTMLTDLTGFEPKLYAYYNFDAASPDTGDDISQNGNDHTGAMLTQSANDPPLTNFYCESGYPNGTCTVGCNNLVQISMDDNCEALVLIDMVMEGDIMEMGDCTYMIELFDKETDTLVDNPVPYKYIGHTLKAVVTATGVGASATNSCWGMVLIEDKLPPVLWCPEDITVSCNTKLVDPYTTTGDQTHCVIPELFPLQIYEMGDEAPPGMEDDEFPVPIPNGGMPINATTSPRVEAWLMFGNLASPLEVVELITIEADMSTVSGSWQEDSVYVKIKLTEGNEFGPIVEDHEGNAIDCILLSGDDGVFEFVPIGKIFLTERMYHFEILVVDSNMVGVGELDGLCATINTQSMLESPKVFYDYCSDAESVLVSNTLQKQNCNSDDISAIQRIVFYAVDESGTASDLCEVNLEYERRDLCDIVMPHGIDGVGDNPEALECKGDWDHNGNNYPDAFVDYNGNGMFDWTDLNWNGKFDFWVDLNGDGIIQPWVDANNNHKIDPGEGEVESIETESGVPLIDGLPIFPNDGFCEINATFSDDSIAICPMSFKILRTWIILDWCYDDEDSSCPRENPYTFFQIIKILDTQGPITSCPPEEFFSADPWTCLGDVWLDPPEIIFECSANPTYSVALLFADEDGDPPVDGEYEGDDVIYAIDEQAHLTGLPYGRTWVRYTVYDECDNTGECFTEITITDDLPPIPVCDEHTVVTLTSNNTAKVWAKTFDDGSWDNCSLKDLDFKVKRMGESDSEFDEVIEFDCWDVPEENMDLMVVLKVTDWSGNMNTCMVSVRIDDKLPPVWHDFPPDITIDCNDHELLKDDGGTDITGEADAWDNCDYVDIRYVDSDNLDECYNGIIYRFWTAEDKSGNENNRTQIIRIENLTPFDVTDDEWDEWLNPADPNDCNITFTTCGSDTSPDGPAGKPQLHHYDDDICALIAYSYEDQKFHFAEDACYKIVREWTIIDWCQYDPNQPKHSNPGLWKKTQIIKVYDDVPPVFGPGCMDVSIEGSLVDCSAEVWLTADVTDNCSQNYDVKVWYTIYFEGGGTETGHSDSFHGEVPGGYHRVVWTAEDGCGNETTCEAYFEVHDEKQPTPICIGGITTVIMPTAGFVDVWAIDFNNGSFDNCCESKDECEEFLDFFVRIHDPAVENPTIPTTQSIRFECEDVGMHELEIWVSDGYNWDYCIVTVYIQANGNTCPDNANNTAIIAGTIHTMDNRTVESVTVSLENHEMEIEHVFETDKDGQYEFGEIRTNTDYKVTAFRNDDHLNGLSTLDLVMIQRHILGIAPFVSSLDILAADVNNSQTITAADMVDLRKLILGVFDELPENTSWKFVDSKGDYSNVSYPWPFIEILNIEQIIEPDMDNNFYAVKVGDVSHNARASKYDEVEIRMAPESLKLWAHDRPFEYGDQVSVPVTAGSAVELIGLQLTIGYDVNALDFVGIESAEWELSNDNLGLQSANEGLISLSWNEAESMILAEGDELFNLVFRAKSQGYTGDALTGNSEITTAEAYNGQLETMNVDLVFGDENAETGDVVELYQNEPNPFSTETKIGFYLPKSAEAVISVYDMTGRQILTVSDYFDSGYQQILLGKDQLSANGILYYQLDVDGYRISRKMILIE